MSAAATMGQLVLLGLPVLAATAMVGVAAVWTAGGRGHWFLRTFALIALLAMSLLVFPRQTLLGLAVEAATIVAGLKAVRFAHAILRARRSDSAREPDEARRYQFSLRDLLMAAVVVAMMAALMARLPAGVWADAKRIAMVGALFGALAAKRPHPHAGVPLP